MARQITTLIIASRTYIPTEKKNTYPICDTNSIHDVSNTVIDIALTISPTARHNRNTKNSLRIWYDLITISLISKTSCMEFYILQEM